MKRRRRVIVPELENEILGSIGLGALSLAA
jgi:hypothetical protein